MSSVFDLNTQNSNLNYKIVAGLERLSHVVRIFLWEKAKLYSLSPIQIQLMIFIQHHAPDKCTISYLAQEFHFTKPTISDAVKVLEQKKLVKKIADKNDSRSYSIQLTAAGKKIVLETEDFPNPLAEIISNATPGDKLVLWNNITNLIIKLNQLQVISIQRTCFNCKHYSTKGNAGYCNLLGQKLQPQDIRMDCNEFEII